jgi:hypothetical protein
MGFSPSSTTLTGRSRLADGAGEVFQLQIFAEAQEDTKDLRQYILESIGDETCNQTST